jgi:hypothetical protein
MKVVCPSFGTTVKVKTVIGGESLTLRTIELVDTTIGCFSNLATRSSTVKAKLERKYVIAASHTIRPKKK